MDNKRRLKSATPDTLLKIFDNLHTKKSEDIFRFKEGTLYPLLYRLEEKKLVKSYRKTAASGKERRLYHVTPQGRKNP